MTSHRCAPVIVAILLFVSCQPCLASNTAPAGRQPLLRDYWPTEGWRTSTPEQQDMNSSRVNEIVTLVEEEPYLHSMVVVRNGYIVSEWYHDPVYGQDVMHAVYSCTKSISSIMIGVAMREGYFQNNVSQSVLGFFPNWTFSNMDSRKQAMMLEHLLTMTAGLDWDEWSLPYTNGLNIYRQMLVDDDPIHFVLDRPMSDDPGTRFVYNSGVSYLLSAIVNVTTGHNALSLAEEHLFGPLGITRYYWRQDPLGVNYGGSELYLTSRDMAKIGYLYLNNGTWDGHEIVTPDWVANSTVAQVVPFANTGYGYQWWSAPDAGVYYASGWQGQYIFVIPRLDLVVSFTAGMTGSTAICWTFLNQIMQAAEEGATGGDWSDYIGFALMGGLASAVAFVAAYWVRARRESV